MAVSPLADHYTRYKLGTAKVIRWLDEQAQRVAERSGNVLNLPNPITTKTLSHLAKMVSLAKPRVAVPISVLLVLEDVIRGRQRCADFYGELEVNTSDGKFTPTNSSHRHFIAVLEEVRTFLKSLEIETPKARERSSSTGHDQAAGKPTRSVKKNIFELLELEEPCEHLQVSPDEFKKADKTIGKQPADPEVDEDTDSKAAMAIWCTFEDIREIRDHLRSVWRDFHNGKISFLAAVELTQTAFLFIQHIAWNFERLNDCPEVPYDDISKFLGIETSVRPNGKMILFMNNANFVATGEAAELLCVPAWTVLQDFRACIDATQNPKYEKVRYSYEPLANTLRQCEPILRHMATVLGDEPASGHVKGFWLDAFTHELLNMCRGVKPIPIETVAWCQVLLDILDALGGQKHLGNDILQDMIKRSSYESRVEGLQQRVEKSVGHGAGRHTRKFFESDDSNILSSSSDKTRSQALAGHYAWPSERNPEDLLKHLPLLAGFRLCHIKAGHLLSSLQTPIGDDTTVDHAALLSMAYLYRAGRSIGLIKGEWEDMETVIASQYMYGLYVRDADSLAGYARHFDLAIGVPATAFARNATRRPGMPGKATIRTKIKKLQCPSSFARRLTHAADLLARGLNGCSAFYTALYKDAQGLNGAPTTHLTSVELLRTIQRNMEADEVYLKFDYLALSKRCKIIFEYLPEAEHAHFKKLLGNGSFDPVEMTHAILWQAADTPLHSRPREIPLLTSFAGIIHVICDFDGSTFLSMAQHGTSGYIALSERPSDQYPWGGVQRINSPAAEEVYSGRCGKNLSLNRIEEQRAIILRATCENFRTLQDTGISAEDCLALTRAWAEEEFVKAELPLHIDEMVVLEEYHKLAISTKFKQTEAPDMLAERFGAAS